MLHVHVYVYVCILTCGSLESVHVIEACSCGLYVAIGSM